MEDVWWAYLAGLIDGEGTFGIVKHKENTTRGFYFCPYISISNTNKNALLFIKEELGSIGNLHKTSTRKQDRGNIKPSYKFDICKRQHIIEIIPKTLPYLIIKKDNALILLEFCRNREEKGRIYRHSKKGRFLKGVLQIDYTESDFLLYNKLREMNRRGKNNVKPINKPTVE